MLKISYGFVELIQAELNRTQCSVYHNKQAGTMKAINFWDSCETVTFKGRTCGSCIEIGLYEKHSVRVIRSL
jgi:hypothetical protein